MKCIVCEKETQPEEKVFVVGEEALHHACYDLVQEDIRKTLTPAA